MWILVLLAAIRLEVRGSERSSVEAGKTLSSAPESMRKKRLEIRSKMEIVEVEGTGKGALVAAIVDRLGVDRRCRFPTVYLGPVLAPS